MQFYFEFYSLPFLVFSLLFFIIFIIFVPKRNIILIKNLSIYFTFFLFFISVFIWIFFDQNNFDYQYIFYLPWLPSLNIYYSLGIDGISIFFVILTTFLTPFCLLFSWENIKYRVKEFVLSLLFLEFFLLNLFMTMDLLFFFIFFESVLLPIFLMIGIWGSRERKIHAAYQLFFYTLFGSIFMLLGILLIYSFTGTTDFQLIFNVRFSEYRQLVLWFMFFFSFSVKVPMIPVHIWLPEAHVEAPTAGSVILAGILLKLGTYGMLRFLIPMFPYASIYYTPFVYTVCIVAIIYASLITIRQIDLKKIIAYSSIAHMNFVILGLFTYNFQGLMGSIYLMLSHGIVSSALFLCVGVLYDRYHTRLLKYYRGLVQVMPIFAILFLGFVLGNIGFPTTSSFVGELLILLGVTESNLFLGFLSFSGIILGVVYSIWLYNRIFFRELSVQYFKNFIDVSLREFYVLVPFFLIMFLIGIYPSILFNVLDLSVNLLIDSKNFL